jgi:hypothetical protein
VISVHAVDPVVGFRLAGLVDGEGCFHISAPRLKGNHYCSFVVKMRADDEPLLELFRDACGGIGGLYRHERKNAWAPTVSWIVRKKAEVAFIRDLFELYPLWSKKQRDFEVWARAVDFWLGVGGGSTDWTTFAAARDELRAVRQFEEVAA